MTAIHGDYPPISPWRRLQQAFCEWYPMTKRRLPSGDQTGCRAAVKSGPTRRGRPPSSGTTQTPPLPGTAESTDPGANPKGDLLAVRLANTWGQIRSSPAISPPPPEHWNLIDAAAISVRPKERCGCHLGKNPAWCCSAAVECQADRLASCHLLDIEIPPGVHALVGGIRDQLAVRRHRRMSSRAPDRW